MLPIYSELANPVKRRIMKVIRSSTIFVVTVYYIIATSGYFSTLDTTPQIIMTRPRMPNYQKDVAQLICCFMIAIVMIVNFVCNYMPFRNSLYFVTTGRRTLITSKLNIAFTIFFVTLNGTVCVVFPQITSVLGIFGGFSSVNICYLIPIFCYIKLRHDEMGNLKNISGLLYMLFLIILGWGSVIITITNLFNGKQ